MCIALIGVLYAIILAIILLKSPDIIPEQRRGNVFSAVGYTCVVVPLLVFEVSGTGLSNISSGSVRHTVFLLNYFFTAVMLHQSANKNAFLGGGPLLNFCGGLNFTLNFS